MWNTENQNEKSLSDETAEGSESKLEPTQPQNDQPSLEASASCQDEHQETLSQAELEEKLEAKTEEARSIQDKFLRLAAEFENYKRRAQRDQTESIRFGNEKLLKDLLPAMDSLERAMNCGDGEANTHLAIIQGVELVYRQFLDILGKFGVRQISSLGEPFDPSKHQAIAQVESHTSPANTVLEEFQKGYFLHDRILRPAMVTVASDQPRQEASPNGERTPDEGGDIA